MTEKQKERYDYIIGALAEEIEITPRIREYVEKTVTKATFMDLRSDWALKHILNDEEVLKMLVGDVLEENIASLEGIHHLPNEIDRFFAGDKDATMDVVAVTKDGRRIIVEIQRQRKQTFPNRIHYYGASMLHAQLKSGDSYSKLRRVHVVCFLDYKMRHNNEQLEYRYSMREKTSSEEFSDLITIHLFELPRMVKATMAGLSPMEGWLFLFKNLHNFDGEPEGMDPRFKKVTNLASFYHLPDTEQLQYIRAMISEEEKLDLLAGAYDQGVDDGFTRGEAKGREEGRAEGREEGSNARSEEIARKMQAAGADPAFIKEMTGIEL